MSYTQVLCILVLACAASLIAFFFGSDTRPSGLAAMQAEAPSISADSIARLDERLERIERALAALASTRVPRYPRTPSISVETEVGDKDDAVDVGDPLRAILERLESLERHLERTGPLSAGSAPGVALDRSAPIDWDAIQVLRNQETGDGKAAIRALRLMTPGEVIGRFGTPTRAEAASGGDWDMWWSYDHVNGTRLELYIKAGYVLHASLRD